MLQLEELQNKNNRLSIMTIAIGTCIKQARESEDAYELSERLHQVVDMLEATVETFEEFANAAVELLESQLKTLSGGADACDELYR